MDQKEDVWVRGDVQEYREEMYLDIVFYKCVNCGHVGKINKNRIKDIFRQWCPSCNKVIVADYMFTEYSKIIDWETYTFEKKKISIRPKGFRP